MMGLAGADVWGWPSCAFALGSLVGLIYAWLALRDSDSEKSFRLSRPDCEARFALALDNLKDLDNHHGAPQSPAQARERSLLESEAVAALKALRAAQVHTPDKSKAAPNPTTHRRAQWTGAAWGAAVASLLAFLLIQVREQSRPTSVPPPRATQADAKGAEIPSEEFEALRSKLTKNPDDVAALVALAHHLLRAQMLDEARTLNERALKLSPMHLEALTHAAVLSASSGDTVGAQAGLSAVLTKDPTFAEAWFFRGMLGMQAGDQDVMRESMAQFLRYAPDGPQKERVRAMIGRSKTP